MAIESKVEAIDHLNEVIANLDGLVASLTLQAANEADTLAHMHANVVDAQIETLKSVREWL